ncbi:Hypothetical predicted protein, partial [Paramuricea clavata]
FVLCSLRHHIHKECGTHQVSEIHLPYNKLFCLTFRFSNINRLTLALMIRLENTIHKLLSLNNFASFHPIQSYMCSKSSRVNMRFLNQKLKDFVWNP